MLQSQKGPDSNAIQLVQYGQRRAKSFLGGSSQFVSPFFGLARESVLAGLAEQDEEERFVVYLRQRAKGAGMGSGDAFILRNRMSSPHSCGNRFTQVISAVPHVRRSRKRGLDDSEQIRESVHTRWHCPQPFDALLRFYHNRGEQVIEIQNTPESAAKVEGPVQWTAPPTIFRSRGVQCPSLFDPGHLCGCLDSPLPTKQSNVIENSFHPVITLGPFKLCIKKGLTYRYQSDYSLLNIAGQEYLHPDKSAEWFSAAKIQAITLREYLRHLIYASIDSDTKRKFDERRKGADSDPFIHRIAVESRLGEDRVWALHALTLVTLVYKDMDRATISLKLVNYSLAKASWLPFQWLPLEWVDPEHSSSTITVVAAPLSRQNAFACIVNFETGDMQIAPEEFEQTIAAASENSMYVTGILLSDPFDGVPDSSIRHIVGNVGRPGISLLVAPVDPQIRPLGNEYNVVAHAPYDGKREDNFEGTSLQLSFTEWCLPIDVEGSRTIDQTAHVIETVISVQDAGKWVADLDVLCIGFEAVEKLQPLGPCPGRSQDPSDYEYTSLDTWEELLDGPSGVGIFRSRGNWAARLAAVSILAQKEQIHSIGLFGPEQVCLECLERARGGRAGLKTYESALPSFCID